MERPLPRVQGARLKTAIVMEQTDTKASLMPSSLADYRRSLPVNQN